MRRGMRWRGKKRSQSRCVVQRRAEVVVCVESAVGDEFAAGVWL